MLMFLSPNFFPMSAMPPRWRPLLRLNPLAQVIEQTRRVAIQGEAPEFGYVVVGLLLGVVIAELGLRLFQKAQGAFADVM
jgi:lipopolysaccharide transport system permease protein